MSARWKLAALGRSVMLAGIVMLTAACDTRPSETYRYRVTVEVQTPQGLRRGSSVWETKAIEGSGIPNTNLRYKGRGEAIVVDLPTGPVFALLRNESVGVDYPHNLITRHLRGHPDSSIQLTDDWRANRRAIKKSRPSFELYPDEYPLLVRFRDINDPASVELVNPTNLASNFGPGVRLNRITVAVTDEDVTGGIEERLPWLGSIGRERGTLIPDPPRLLKDASPIQLVSPGDFSTELYK